ncbi:BTAD domain-containing putative transcriptional regulator [Streptomyces sp. NPDC058251]|uniref:AfsR/SARP family transcriptional regulator n=1 Tax=unclassified Streptomyces TaxID=2593676 RepID=UPI0036E6C323
MEKPLRFKILGPLGVLADDGQVKVGGPRHRTILALLLLNPERTVSVDKLVDAVWGDQPPATARTQVSICIAALRKSFRKAGITEEVIVTAHPGYLLRATGHRLDSLEFSALVSSAERAVQEKRLSDAARHYEEALRLWQGPALAGVTGAAVEDEARRLEELRLNTYDDAIAVELELGHHQRIIPELDATVRAHPMRERTRLHLITAQYRSGRRAEAMETFRLGRRLFINELGLEPGPALRELHDAILHDDVEPAAGEREPAAAERERPRDPVGKPFELPPDVPGFTGRVREMALLDALLERTDEVRGPTAGLITGVGGLGKTCLAVHWAHSVSAHFPDGHLFADLRGYDDNHEPAPVGEVLGRFLRSLGVPGDRIPMGVEERASLYRSILAERRVLVVLDNVHSYPHIVPLLPSSPGCCVLITSREQLAALVAWPPQCRVQLGRLTGPEAVGLLSRIVGERRVADDPASVARVAELCDRLPLALRIAGARLAAKPHWTVARLVSLLSDERRRLDELSEGESQVRAGFALSYRCLSEEAARLYRLLGLLEVPDFAPWLGAALVDADPATAERLLEQLVDAQFLDVTGADARGRPRYRFQNLLRLYAHERTHAEESEPERRAARERVFRSALSLAELAHRRFYGGDFSIIHGTAPRRPVPDEAAAELSARPLEWLEAERHTLSAVVEQAAELGLDELAWDLTMSTVVLFETRDHTDDWRACAERALAAARTAGNVRGQAAMLHILGALEMRLRRFPEADDRFATALALHTRAGERHGRALVLRSMAMIDEMRGELTRAMSRSTEALEVFREVGDLSSEAHVLNNMAQIELDRGHVDRAAELGRESVRVAEAIGAGGTRSLALATHRLGRVLVAQGRFARAEETLLRMVRIVQDNSDTLGLAHGLLALGEARLGAGRWEQARMTLTQALDAAVQVSNPLVEGKIKLALGEACGTCGHRARALHHLTEARECFARIDVKPWLERVDRALEGLAGERAQAHPPAQPSTSAHASPDRASTARAAAAASGRRR